MMDDYEAETNGSITDAIASTGTYSMRIDASGGAYIRKNFASGRPSYLAYSLRADSITPGSGLEYNELTVRIGTPDAFAETMMQAQMVGAFGGVISPDFEDFGFDSFKYSIDTWHRIEYVNIDWWAGTYEFQIDGQSRGTFSFAGTGPDRIEFEVWDNVGAGTEVYWVDDIVVK